MGLYGPLAWNSAWAKQEVFDCQPSSFEFDRAWLEHEKYPIISLTNFAFSAIIGREYLILYKEIASQYPKNK